MGLHRAFAEAFGPLSGATLLLGGGGPLPAWAAAIEISRRRPGGCLSWGPLRLPGFARPGSNLKRLVRKLRRHGGVLAAGGLPLDEIRQLAILSRRLGFPLLVSGGAAEALQARLFGLVVVAPEDSSPGVPHDTKGLVFYKPHASSFFVVGKAEAEADAEAEAEADAEAEAGSDAGAAARAGADAAGRAEVGGAATGEPPQAAARDRRPPFPVLAGREAPPHFADFSLDAVALRNFQAGAPLAPPGVDRGVWGAFSGPEPPEPFGPETGRIAECLDKIAADPSLDTLSAKLVAYLGAFNLADKTRLALRRDPKPAPTPDKKPATPWRRWIRGAAYVALAIVVIFLCVRARAHAAAASGPPPARIVQVASRAFRDLGAAARPLLEPTAAAALEAVSA